MKEALNIAILQCDIYWEDASKNRSQIEEYIQSLTDVDLILLPEMFSTGFSVSSIHLAEKMDGLTVNWMKRIAKKYYSVLCGSLMIEEDGLVYNRLLWVEPSGAIQQYDKRHLFKLIDEDKYFTAGTQRLLIDYKGWKICPLICYDLRFPVFSRNDVDYDLLLYVANWPNKRISAWDTLLKARAIENQSYVIGLNRVGVEGNNAHYSGHSQVIDPEGNLIANAPENESGLLELTLTKAPILQVRKRLPFLSDRDDFNLNNS
tara:strand:- start:34 stop:816 length:783 start_codon:yes stop_codon:yes gene_type:complete